MNVVISLKSHCETRSKITMDITLGWYMSITDDTPGGRGGRVMDGERAKDGCMENLNFISYADLQALNDCLRTKGVLK